MYRLDNSADHISISYHSRKGVFNMRVSDQLLTRAANDMKSIKKCWHSCTEIFPCANKFLLWEISVAAVKAAINIANLYFLRFAINNVQEGGEFYDSATVLLFICAGIIVSQVILAPLSVKINARKSYEIQSAVKGKLFAKAISVDLSCYEDSTYYNKYTFTMSQCANKISQLIDTAASFTSAFISIVSCVALSAMIDPVTLPFAFLPFVTLLISKKRNKINHAANQKISDINRQKDYVRRVFYQDAYAKDMRTTNIHKPLFTRFLEASERIVEVHRREGSKVAAVCMIEFFVKKVLSEYAVLVYAAWKTIIDRSMQYGDCLIIVSTLQNIYDSVNDLLETGSSVHEISLYMEDLHTFLEENQTEQAPQTAKVASSGDIMIEKLSFCYPRTDRYVLKDISMHIRKGEKIAIVGPNGAGKSTFVKLLLGLYAPSAGRIVLNGEDYRDLDMQSIRDVYSVVLQDYRHFSISVKENIELGTPADDEAASLALEKSGLLSRVSKMKNGMHSLLDKEIDASGEILSGGEQQKLAIAHVYLQNSDIIILDEPASALDPIAEHEMYERMLNMSDGKTVIFISHRLSSTTMADRIYYLEHGRVAECGTHEELMENGGLYSELFRIQAENYQEE